MSAEIVPLKPRFDPSTPGAERRYDGIVARLNKLLALRERGRRECAELERQFVEDDLVATSGARRGQPLTARGRRQRLELLLAKTGALRELGIEAERLHAQLESMNRALDEWARENWGMGSGE